MPILQQPQKSKGTISSGKISCRKGIKGDIEILKEAVTLIKFDDKMLEQVRQKSLKWSL